MDNTAKEVELFDAEALEVGAREDETGLVVYLDCLDEFDGGGGSAANGGGDGGGGGDHGRGGGRSGGFVVMVVGDVAEGVGVGISERRGSVGEEERAFVSGSERVKGVVVVVGAEEEVRSG